MNAARYRYEELTPQRFEELIAGYPDIVVPLEQTPQWAQFERETGRRPFGIFAYFEPGPLTVSGPVAAGTATSPAAAQPGGPGTLVAVASYLHSTRRFRESMVVVNGPVWFTERTPAAEKRLLDTLRSQFGADPRVDPVFVRLQVENPQPPVVKALEPGWYDREIVVDLTKDEKAMLASFRPNARQSIRKAVRAGVEVRTIDRSVRRDVFRRELYPIMQETASRDEFASFGSGYYEQLLESLSDQTELMVAYLDGKAICWLITTEYRGYSVYYFAASSAEARRTFAPYLLLWESFRMLKARGNHSCGLTGIVSDTYPSLANVTTFKRNFSKNAVVLPTTFDVPLKPFQFMVLAAALRLRREGPGRLRAAVAAARGLAGRLGRPGPAPAGQSQPPSAKAPTADSSDAGTGTAQEPLAGATQQKGATP